MKKAAKKTTKKTAKKAAAKKTAKKTVSPQPDQPAKDIEPEESTYVDVEPSRVERYELRESRRVPSGIVPFNMSPSLYHLYRTVDWTEFGNLLRERMREAERTVSDVSRDLGWSSTLAHLSLRGSRRIPSSRFAQLIDYFNLTEAEIPRVTGAKTKGKGTKIFVSYSHKDREFLDRLMVHLKPLEKKGLIDPWVDTRLLAGDRWKKEIAEALKSARVAILLLSADFLASDFIIDNELPPLLHAAEEKGTLIIPVILKPCRFTREKSLREFQAINPPDEPLSLQDENERELIYDTIAQRIEDAFPETTKD